MALQTVSLTRAQEMTLLSQQEILAMVREGLIRNLTIDGVDHLVLDDIIEIVTIRQITDHE